MGLTAFNRMRRKAKAAPLSDAVQSGGTPNPDPGKKAHPLNQMNKAALTEYAASLGLAFSEEKTRQQMIDEIQAREAENRGHAE